MTADGIFAAADESKRRAVTRPANLPLREGTRATKMLYTTDLSTGTARTLFLGMRAGFSGRTMANGFLRFFSWDFVLVFHVKTAMNNYALIH